VGCAQCSFNEASVLTKKWQNMVAVTRWTVKAVSVVGFALFLFANPISNGRAAAAFFVSIPLLLLCLFLWLLLDRIEGKGYWA